MPNLFDPISPLLNPIDNSGFLQDKGFRRDINRLLRFEFIRTNTFSIRRESCNFENNIFVNVPTFKRPEARRFGIGNEYSLGTRMIGALRTATAFFGRAQDFLNLESSRIQWHDAVPLGLRIKKGVGEKEQNG